MGQKLTFQNSILGYRYMYLYEVSMKCITMFHSAFADSFLYFTAWASSTHCWSHNLVYSLVMGMWLQQIFHLGYQTSLTSCCWQHLPSLYIPPWHCCTSSMCTCLNIRYIEESLFHTVCFPFQCYHFDLMNVQSIIKELSFYILTIIHINIIWCHNHNIMFEIPLIAVLS
jgi:hypothetical protein